MTVTFCGHSDTQDSPELRAWLREKIIEQIENGADAFFLGGYGSFDRIAATVVWELKKEYPNIESILVLPYLDRDVDASKYDSTTYPPLENVPRRFAISKRNRWMVENAAVILADVSHGWGGAAQMLEYAIKKKKTVFNFGKWEPDD